MRTIKKPNETVSCPKCNAVMEIEREDIELDDTGMYPAFYIRCPHCNSAIDVAVQAKKLGASA